VADFTPKKLSTEKGSAKGGIGAKPPASQDEAARPPTLYLEHHHLEKLGMKKMPAVGSKIKISGVAHVGATSEHNDGHPPGEREGSGQSTGPSTRRSMTLHLHSMDMGADQQSSDAKDESQRDGMKSEIDKALTQHAGSEAAKGKAKGKTPTPRGGGD
jgi:hypothetical protein